MLRPSSISSARAAAKPTSPPRATARSSAPSTANSIASATSSSASSASSNTSEASQLASPSSQGTSSPPSYLHAPAYGPALMSPRPSAGGPQLGRSREGYMTFTGARRGVALSLQAEP